MKEDFMESIPEPIDVGAIEALLRRSLSIHPEDSFSIEVLSSERHHQHELSHLSASWPAGCSYPTRLLRKTCQKLTREISFYQAVHQTNLPVPRCLFCEYCAESGTSQLILEDLTTSHTDISDWPEALPQQAGFEVVEALAEIHAAFWYEPGPNESKDDGMCFLKDRNSYLAHLAYLKRDSEMFFKAHSDRAGQAHKDLYGEVLSILPGLWDSFWEGRISQGGLPLIHGDLNPRNILYPRHAPERVVLIDWEAQRRGLPTTDLAMLMGLHLCPDFDEVRPFLERYHQRLIQGGVKNYDFDDFLSDYEIALLFEMFFPLKLFAEAGIFDELMLEKAVHAVNSTSAAGF
jgi:thiamine kinase-like enzyme